MKNYIKIFMSVLFLTLANFALNSNTRETVVKEIVNTTPYRLTLTPSYNDLNKAIWPYGYVKQAKDPEEPTTKQTNIKLSDDESGYIHQSIDITATNKTNDLLDVLYKPSYEHKNVSLLVASFDDKDGKEILKTIEIGISGNNRFHNKHQSLTNKQMKDEISKLENQLKLTKQHIRSEEMKAKGKKLMKNLEKEPVNRYLGRQSRKEERKREIETLRKREAAQRLEKEKQRSA